MSLVPRRASMYTWSSYPITRTVIYLVQRRRRVALAVRPEPDYQSYEPVPRYQEQCTTHTGTHLPKATDKSEHGLADSLLLTITWPLTGRHPECPPSPELNESIDAYGSSVADGACHTQWQRRPWADTQATSL